MATPSTNAGCAAINIELADHHREFGQRYPGFDILEVLLQ
jgi:hypothetical protein